MQGQDRSPGEDVRGCSIDEMFHLLGRTHVMDILRVFIHEDPNPERFVHLQDRLSISPSTLSARLKELVATGLLTRTAYNQIPPRVDYQATPKALELQPVFDSLIAWTQRNDLKPEDAEAELETV